MGRKIRILVVDGDRSTVLTISSVLTKSGCDVETAYDGVEGLKKARETKPDLIILDVMIPLMDGYEVARRLKADPETRDLTILMLSARGDIDENVKRQYQFATRVKDRMAAFDSGAVEFITKPVQAKELVKRVRAILWAGGLAVR